MRNSLLTLTIATLAISASAAPLTPDEALGRAINSGQMRVAGKSQNFKLAKIQKIADRDAVYVFSRSNGDGFVVASADDCAPALLGYGDSRLCDSDGQMAPAFEEWLASLARQIDFAAQNPVEHKTYSLRREEKAPIEPLCKTLWGQDAPFNDLCPVKNGKNTVTGCVATAMSQVMKYHNWPEQGEGSNSYTWSGQRFNVDFSNVTFEWDKMLDEYDESSSEAACEAVANLMVNVAISVSMDFALDGSGALSVDIAPALGKYFKYDKSLQYVLRDYYTLPEWEDMIYNSLSQYGPVIYDAQAGLGGHSFVCDGYQGDGYFHFNWGWRGMSDGYFLLDALDPPRQGIGGANGGFNFMQDAILGIRPDKTGDSEWSFIMYGQNVCTYALDTSIRVISLRSTFKNYGPGTIPQCRIGLEFRNIDDPDADPVFEVENFGTIRIGLGANGLAMGIPELPNGRYNVQPVYFSGENGPYYVTYPVYGKGTCTLTVNDGKYSIQTTTTELPTFVDGVYPEQINLYQPIHIQGKLENPNDAPYLCYFSIALFDANQEEVLGYSAPAPIEMDPLGTVDVDRESNMLLYGMPPDGTYYIAPVQLVLPEGFLYTLDELQMVKVVNSNGINELIDTEFGGETEIYTLDGVKINPTQNVPAGIYIFRSAKGSQKVIVR